jgi:SRSO17 transposase
MDKEAEFAKYVSALSETLLHADRVGPMHDYCRGLM